MFLAEMFGTMVLILLGDGVVANVLLNRSKGQNAGWIVITAGWAFAVMSGVFVSSALGGPGSLNPAGEIAGIVRGGNVNTAVLNIAGEFVGAFIGAILVWLVYLPHWSETADKGLKLAVFSTGPAIRNPAMNVLTEAIATFALIFIVNCIFKAAGTTLPGGLGPYLVGALIWGLGLSLGGPTGYALNPARDLGPRIAHFLLPISGKGDSDWAYSWVPVVGPIIGAVVAALLLTALKV
ncbi:MAG: MIP/aquaporin family protein [Chloroflexales bacterium]